MDELLRSPLSKNQQLLRMLKDFTGEEKGSGRRRRPNWYLLAYLVQSSPPELVANLHDPTSGSTLLHLCAFYGKAVYMELILSKGASPHVLDAEGNNALHVACSGDAGHDANLREVAVLLRHGVQVATQKRTAKVPLFCAIYSESEHTVRTLLDAGADPLALLERRGGARGARPPLCLAVELRLPGIALDLVRRGGARVEGDRSCPAFEQRRRTHFEEDEEAVYIQVLAECFKACSGEKVTPHSTRDEQF